MSQPVVHLEIGGDAASLQTYFAQLFGWRIEPAGPAGYGLVRPGAAGGVTIGIGSADDGHDSGLIVYVAVPDVGSALERAEKLGGRRLAGPDPMPGCSTECAIEVGRFADPLGHVIGLVTVDLATDPPDARPFTPSTTESAKGSRS